MKKALVFLAVLCFADVSNIIKAVKEIENYKPYFKSLDTYNIFAGDIVLPKIKKKKINNTKEIKLLTLNAIFQNKANINGIWVKKGDILEGYKVIKITKHKVVLKKDEKVEILSLKTHYLKVK